MTRFIAAPLLLLSSIGFAADCPAWLDHEVKKLHSSQAIDVCAEVAGKPVLIVNTASHCGFTGQFAGLEALHQRYKDQGLVVMGFPSNAFNQESDDSAETARVCYKNFGVTFLMSDKVDIKGEQVHPIFAHLNAEQGEASWNFNKYLVAKDGTVVQRFGSTTSPESNKLVSAIEEQL